ncbi:MAG: hypothetical protein AVDCRST_MAG18-5087, partial [uncultured Thermomicrobiales bacterium]
RNAPSSTGRSSTIATMPRMTGHCSRATNLRNRGKSSRGAAPP